ncbi:uncharacterized protein LOC131996706 [Stomoxys calcitrans]|uniref:uncharacterized protein LOC131996706 n=1 Tax=Stomoxys calcitrans TaxID=35570 RepID=UPI0027E34C92|nr:uncharacterized protein LOC131996706 [Stomoxys calcitrans]
MSLDKFIRLSDRLVEFEALLNDKHTKLSSCYAVETHKEEVKEIWDRLKPVYEQCLGDLEEEAVGDEMPFGGNDEKASEVEMVKSKFRSAFSTYCRCVEHLGEVLQQLSQPISTTASNQPQGFKLPPCEIPTFGGDYPTWPTFRDMFTAVCIRNSRLSPVEKLFHLTQRTKGEANEIVRKFPLTQENFALAWRSLCSRYENKRVLVNTQLKALFNISSIHSESAGALKSLQRDINACISMLKLYDIDVDSWDPIFIYICSSRLPDVTLTLWEQTLEDKTLIPKWSVFDTFLTNRHRTLESVSEIRKKDTMSTGSNTGQRSCPKSGGKNIRAFQNKVSESNCKLCPNEVHVIRKCPKFLQMSVNQRLAEIKRLGLCLNCFSKSHSVRHCSSKFSCLRCNKRHNSLLHREQTPSTQGQPDTNAHTTSSSVTSPIPNSCTLQSTNSGGGLIQTCFSSHSKGVLLGTAMVKICHNGLDYLARALVDSGSEGTFISEKLFNQLKLPFKRMSASISGLNNTISASVQKECRFKLNSIVDPNFEVWASALVVPHLSGSLPSRTFHPNSLVDLPDIPFADPRFYESSKIDLLLGGDILPFIMLSGIRREVCGSLLAQETVFGWILTGPIPSESIPSSPRVVSYFCEVALESLISRFWEVEDLPRKTFLSRSDQYCEDLYAATTTRDKEGRYMVSLPFREGFPEDVNIGHSRNCAMAQFIRNEARLLRNPVFKSEYDKVLEEYTSLKHMSRVSAPKDVHSCDYYYLPHHAVVKPESTTTKVRVVFNASSPSSNGVSLNDVLYAGPVLQNDLVVLILRWRFFRYVFNGDITKMYRQILIRPEHRVFQRILHRIDPNGSISDYELDTVTFGVNCAPFLAIRTILQLADDVKESFPLAAHILRDSMYVDDALAGAHTIEDAIESRNQLIRALMSAGFSMRKWASNSKMVLSDLSTDQLLSEDFLNLDDRSTAKTLGIRWNASSDSFYFSTSPFPDNCKFTKREILSQISKLFDPAGWLAPCIVIAKMIMQTIWTEGTKWDEEVSPQSLSGWRCFQSAYPSINSIVVPRWFEYSPDCDIQFHGFSDASEKAYAAALYVRKAYFPDEYLALSAKKTIASKSSLLSLNPFLDDEGVMRICGRLTSSPVLSYNERHPVILPYSSQLSRLLVKFTHEISIHGGNQLVLRLLRMQFWIIKVKNLIKTIINRCKPCILYKQRCQRQMMSALPPERTEIFRPFTHTGLDFTGPFDIKNYSGRCCRITKGYVCVFVCFATKAIHLEPTSDLSTNTFLAAFTRFASRRGCPLHLYSDNGTNFVGASKVLARDFLQSSQQLLESKYAHQAQTSFAKQKHNHLPTSHVIAPAADEASSNSGSKNNLQAGKNQVTSLIT